MFSLGELFFHIVEDLLCSAVADAASLARHNLVLTRLLQAAHPHRVPVPRARV